MNEENKKSPANERTIWKSQSWANSMNRDARSANGRKASEFWRVVEDDGATPELMAPYQLEESVIPGDLSSEQWRQLWANNRVKYRDIPEKHRQYVMDKNITGLTNEVAPYVGASLAAPIAFGEGLGLASGQSALNGLLEHYVPKAFGMMNYLQPSTYINMANAGTAGAYGMLGAAVPTTAGLLADFAMDASLAKPSVEAILNGSRSGEDIFDAVTSFAPYTPIAQGVGMAANAVAPMLGAMALPFMRFADNANDVIDATEAAASANGIVEMTSDALRAIVRNANGRFSSRQVADAASELRRRVQTGERGIARAERAEGNALSAAENAGKNAGRNIDYSQINDEELQAIVSGTGTHSSREIEDAMNEIRRREDARNLSYYSDQYLRAIAEGRYGAPDDQQQMAHRILQEREASRAAGEVHDVNNATAPGQVDVDYENAVRDAARETDVPGTDNIAHATDGNQLASPPDEVDLGDFDFDSLNSAISGEAMPFDDFVSTLSDNELQEIINDGEQLFYSESQRNAAAAELARRSGNNATANTSVQGRRELHLMDDDEFDDLYYSVDESDPANGALMDELNAEALRRGIHDNLGQPTLSDDFYTDDLLNNTLDYCERVGDQDASNAIRNELSRRGTLRSTQNANAASSAAQNAGTSEGRLSSLGLQSVDDSDNLNLINNINDELDIVNRHQGHQFNPSAVVSTLDPKTGRVLAFEAAARGCLPEDLISYIAGVGDVKIGERQTVLSSDLSNLGNVVISDILRNGKMTDAGFISVSDLKNAIIDTIESNTQIRLTARQKASLNTAIYDKASWRGLDAYNTNDLFGQNGIAKSINDLSTMKIDGGIVTLGGKQLDLSKISRGNVNIENLISDSIFRNFDKYSMSEWDWYLGDDRLPLSFENNVVSFDPKKLEFTDVNSEMTGNRYDEYADLIDDLFDKKDIEEAFGRMSKEDMSRLYAGKAGRSAVNVRTDTGRGSHMSVNKGTRQHMIDDIMEKRAVELGLAEDGKHITKSDVLKMYREENGYAMRLNVMAWNPNFNLRRNSDGLYTGRSHTTHDAVSKTIAAKEEANAAHIANGGDPNNLPYPDIPEKKVLSMQKLSSSNLWSKIATAADEAGDKDLRNLINELYDGDSWASDDIYSKIKHGRLATEGNFEDFDDFIGRLKKKEGYKNIINQLSEKYDISFDDYGTYAVSADDFIGRGPVDADVEIPEKLFRDYTNSLYTTYGDQMRETLPRHGSTRQDYLSTDSLPANILGTRQNYGFGPGQFSVDFKNEHGRYGYSTGDDWGTLKINRENVKSGVGYAAYDKALKDAGYNENMPDDVKAEIKRNSKKAQREALAKFSQESQKSIDETGEDLPIIKELAGFFEGKHADVSLVLKYQDEIQALVRRRQEQLQNMYRNIIDIDSRARNEWNLANPGKEVEIPDYSDMALPTIHIVPYKINQDEGIHLMFDGMGANKETTTLSGASVPSVGFAVPTVTKHRNGGLLLKQYAKGGYTGDEDFGDGVVSDLFSSATRKAMDAAANNPETGSMTQKEINDARRTRQQQNAMNTLGAMYKGIDGAWQMAHYIPNKEAMTAVDLMDIFLSGVNGPWYGNAGPADYIGTSSSVNGILSKPLVKSNAMSGSANLIGAADDLDETTDVVKNILTVPNAEYLQSKWYGKQNSYDDGGPLNVPPLLAPLPEQKPVEPKTYSVTDRNESDFSNTHFPRTVAQDLHNSTMLSPYREVSIDPFIKQFETDPSKGNPYDYKIGRNGNTSSIYRHNITGGYYNIPDYLVNSGDPIDLSDYTKMDPRAYRNLLPKRDYVGGTNEETRWKFANMVPGLLDLVNEKASLYGISPSLLYERLSHEGFLDHGARIYNDNINTADRSQYLKDFAEYGPSVYGFDNNYVNGYYDFGLDDAGSNLIEGRYTLKSPVEWWEQEGDNEHGRPITSVATKNVSDMMEIMAAEIAYRRDVMKKRGIPEDLIDTYTNAAFNMGLYNKNLNDRDFVLRKYSYDKKLSD